MKKVLLLGPEPSSKGGVTIWMKIILEALNDYRQEDVEVVHLPITRSVSLTHLLPVHKRLYYSIKDYANGMKDLVGALRKEKYDKVHILSSLGAGIVRDWLFVKIASRHKAKAIVHYHCGTMPKHLSSNDWKRKLLVSTLKNSYKSIVLDDESYKAITSAGFSNVVKIGNSFNKEIELLENKNIAREKNRVLFVGHNVREKGIFELIEALSTIENIILDIYGPQDEIIHAKIEEWIRNNGFNGKVNFNGLQPSIEIFKAMRRAGLFVLPTYSEGFPYVIVEAMASGCPIISTPVGAIEEMLTQENELHGYLVQPKDYVALRNQVMYCLNNMEETNRKAGKAKSKAYAEYSTKAIMNKFFNLWKE